MAELAPTSRIHADLKERVLYFAIAGFWTRDAMEEFLKDLARAAVPFFKEKVAFTAMGNLSDFVPQDRATADAIRQSLLEGSQNGLKRFAIVSPPPLVKMQYKRISAGLDFEFFDDEPSAKAWLRGQA